MRASIECGLFAERHAGPWIRLALGMALAGHLAFAGAADAWTQEGQDAGAASRNSEQTVLNPGNLGQMITLWSRDLDIWAQSTGIAVADGQVFVGRKVADPDTTVRQQLMRLDLQTGATVWKANSPESFGTPVIAGDLVIVAGNGLGLPATATPVRAYDRATGERRWQYVHPLPSVSFKAPHLLDGVLYLVSLEGDTVALDAATGGMRWRRNHDANCCSTNGLAVGEGVVLISRSKGLLALDAADGRTLWRYDMPDFRLVTVRPMIVDGVALMFDHQGVVHRFDLATGAEQWSVTAPPGDFSSAMGPMASDGERVFVLSGVVRPRLSAIDLATGIVLWTVSPGKWTHSPIVSDGVLYLANHKHVMAVDPATGAPLPIAHLQAMRWGELVIADGHMLTSGGPVRAFGLP